MFRFVLSLVASCLLPAMTLGGTTSFSGTLSTTDPTYTRAQADIAGFQSNVFLGYSGIGDNVFYNVHRFTVTQTDSFTITAVPNVGPTSTYISLTLYQSPFDPTNAATNYLSDSFEFPGANPPGWNGGGAGIIYTLNPGISYELVVGTRYNGDTGTYVVTIAAPNGTAIPEPNTLTLLGIGLAACVRRRFWRTRV